MSTSKVYKYLGTTRNYLEIIRRVDNIGVCVAVECRCILCGTKKNIKIKDILAEKTVSCGCYSKKQLVINNSERLLANGNSSHPLYDTWYKIFSRCCDTRCTKYPDYGGRGIKMCQRWHKDTFEGFENFIQDMGDRPSCKHTVDRIDNNGDYCPENCVWHTGKQQNGNKRTTYKVNYFGKTVSLLELCSQLGLNYKKAYNKLYKGSSIYMAILE